MTIFRNKKDKLLYVIYKVTPRMYTGSWFEAEGFGHDNKIKHCNLDHFKAEYHA